MQKVEKLWIYIPGPSSGAASPREERTSMAAMMVFECILRWEILSGLECD